MVAFFHTVFYDPIYNGLIFLIDIVPGGDVGLSIILLTVVVRFILFPLSMSAARTQVKMRLLEPRLAEIKERFKKDRQQQALKTMELYREEGVRPFASILSILIQLPIIIALYLVFVRGGLPTVHTDLLYSFVPVPEMVSNSLLGLVDMGSRNLVFAVLAGLTQFVHAHIVAPRLASDGKGFRHELARSMQVQMKYFLPLLIGFFAYTLFAAVALYWTVSNIFTILQELYVRRTLNRNPHTPPQPAR